MTNEEFKRIAFKYDGEGKPVTFGSRDVPQSFQQQTFLHELVHAILNTMRKDDLYDDESFVNTFASFLNEAINTME